MSVRALACAGWRLYGKQALDSVEASSYKKLQILSRYVAGEAKETIKALLAIPSAAFWLFFFGSAPFLS